MEFLNEIVPFTVMPLGMYIFFGFMFALVFLILYSEEGGKNLKFAIGFSILMFLLWPLVLMGVCAIMLIGFTAMAIGQIQKKE